ncbi:MAG: LamG-like jellyroll fold domain-containing protein, partial [Candidatus Omnitrophota bacterium]
MLYLNRFAITFKTISACVAGIFLWSQIAWAGDFIDNTLEKQYNDQSQMFAPDYLKAQQSLHESITAQKQDMEDSMNTLDYKRTSSDETQSSEAEVLDLKGPGSVGVVSPSSEPEQLENTGDGNKSSGDEPFQEGAILSVTTEAGDIIYYLNNKIHKIEMADGTIFRNIRLDEESNLLDAEMEYPDGTIQVVSNGKVIRITKPDGTILNYNADELISSIVYPDAATVMYTYIRDAGGNILEIILTDAEKVSHYTSNGKLKKVVFNTGKIIEYDDGILSRVTEEDGTVYIYERSEVTVDGQAEYVVTLKEILSCGMRYIIENNNIVAIELPDGALIEEFRFNDDGKLREARIEYADGSHILIKDNRIWESENAAGVKVSYAYELGGEDEVLSCTVTIDNGIGLKEYVYIKDPAKGGLTIEEENGVYEYNALFALERFTNDAGIFEHSYDLNDNYTGSIALLKDGTTREYDAYGKLSNSTLPDGTIYEYYLSGPFTGNLKREISPGSQPIHYNYKITDDGNLKVSKEQTYSATRFFKRYYSEGNIDYLQNPSLKTVFRLDSSKIDRSPRISASYRETNYGYIGITLEITDNVPLMRHSYNNYQTDEYRSEAIEPDMVIKDDTDYTVEYIWTETSVDVYLYESSDDRPDTPVYSLADNNWDPQFDILPGGASIAIDPSSSGVYIEEQYGSAFYFDNDRLSENYVFTAEFSFHENDMNKSFMHGIGSYEDRIYFMYDGTSHFHEEGFDWNTGRSSGTVTPLDITFDNDKTYVSMAKLEGGTLNYYVYEKGTDPGDPAYTRQNSMIARENYAHVINGALNVEANDILEIYEYDNISGNIIEQTIMETNEKIAYIYGQDGELMFRELLSEDDEKRTYDIYNRLVKLEGESGETILYGYDDSGRVISVIPEFPDNTTLIYYDAGDFVGNLKKAIFPDGKAVLYDYRITDGENLAIYKRVSYDASDTYVNYNGISSVDYKTYPSYKTDFRLDGSKSYTSVYAGVSNNNYPYDRLSLTLHIQNQTSYIIYYEYDYSTGNNITQDIPLDIAVDNDTDYTIEYLWTDNGVNVYLYESSQDRPGTPLYTLSDHQWSPRFDAGGTNANVIPDPCNNDEYARSMSIYSDYNTPLKTSPIHMTEFTFDDNVSSKSLIYDIHGRSDTSNDYITFSYRDSTPYVRVERYNRQTRESTYDRLPIDVTLEDGKTYVVETRIEEEILRLYVYEKGQDPGEPVCTLEDVSWDPKINSSIYGGELNLEAYYDLEICEYNTEPVALFNKDIGASLRNKNIIIDDPYKVIPSYALGSEAPLVFPDGMTDIVNDVALDIDFVGMFPGDMFDIDGDIIPDYDFGNTPYFNVIKYDRDSIIKEILKPGGDVLTYESGLPTCSISGLETTLYDFTPTDFGSISNIIVERANVRRVYDPITGELLSLEKDGVEVLLGNRDESSIEFKFFDGSLLTAPTFNENGEIEDGVFERFGNDGNAIQRTEYKSGKLMFYMDGTGNEYRYDENGDLIELKKRVDSETFVTYIYTPGLITVATVPEDQRALLNDDDPVIIKYENTASGRRIIYLETKAGLYKNLDYTQNYIEVTEGVIRLVDYQKLFVKERLKKYNYDLLLLSIEENDGTTALYEYNPDNTFSRVTVIKDDVDYLIEDGRFYKMIEPDGTVIEYYPSGWARSKTLPDGRVINYEYGASTTLTLDGTEEDVEIVDIDGETTLQLSSHFDPSLSLLLNLNGDPTPDISGNSHSVKFHGNAHLDTGDARFGTSALALDGNGDYMTLPDSDDWQLGGGNGDWTVDLWINLDTFAGNGKQYGLIQQWDGGTDYWYWYISGSATEGKYVHYFVSYDHTIGNTWYIVAEDDEISTNTWYHFAAVRNGNDFAIYKNGTDITTAEDNTPAATISSTGNLEIGRFGWGAFLDGRIDDLCISDVAKWTSDFTPPSSEYNGYLFNGAGTFTSNPIELNATEISTISWNEMLPQNTDITVQIRTGNTPDPDDGTWGDWSGSLTDPQGLQVALDAAKYIQYKVNLCTTDPLTSPVLLISNDNNTLTIDYISELQDVSNAGNISYVKVVVNDTVSYYDLNGINIHNPDDSIDMSNLTIDQSLVDEIIGGISNEDTYLDINPGAGLSFEETSEQVWFGKVNPEDMSKLNDTDASILLYEIGTNGDSEEKRIMSFKKKNGDITYYYYDAGTNIVEDIKDENGKTYAYKVSTYDENGIIQQVKFFYDDETKDQIISYENGRIKNATQDGNVILNYTYELLEGGREFTVINDFSYGGDNPVKKHYIDGQLVKTIDKDNIETAYRYDKDGRILTSIISRRGKEMEVYRYTYDSEKEHTTIEDMTGVKKVYDSANKLLYVEKDNKIYAYYYVHGETSVKNDDIERIKNYMDSLRALSDANGLLRDTDLSTEFGEIEDTYTYIPGDNFAVEELIQYMDEDDNVIRFNEGKIESITRNDGIVISDIIYKDEEIMGYKVIHPAEMDGVTYTIKDNYVYSEEKLDGSATYYHSNGWVKSRIDREGKETEYIYEVPLTLTGKAEGTTYYTYIEDENGDLILTLDEGGPPAIEDLSDSLLLHFNGDNDINSPIDSSIHNHLPITFYGNARLDTETKKFGTSSLALDGSGDYIMLPDSDEWNFGNEDFTIDFWAKFRSPAYHAMMFSQTAQGVSPAHSANLNLSSGKNLYFTVDDYTQPERLVGLSGPGWNPSSDQWYHIAVVRYGDTWTMYMNGEAVDSVSGNSSAYPDYDAPLLIGKFSANDNYFFDGWIDEFRISKGIAQWTSDFSSALPDSQYQNPYTNSGTFTSNPIELNAIELYTISWNEITPEGTDVTIETRTGDTANPEDDNWSGWSEALTDPGGSQITSSPAKYLQYKVTLKRTSESEIPSIDLESIKIDLLSHLSEGNDENLTHSVEYDGKAYIYDGRERLIKIIDGDITYTYTPEGKTESVTEADGKVTTYVYDEKDRTSLVEIIVNEAETELHYDTERRLTKVIESTTGTQYEYFYHGDMVTLKTAYVSKQASREDFSGFDKDGIAIDDYEGVTHVRLERQVPLDYGTGEDGELVVRKGETRVLEAGTYNFESIYIEEGAMLTVEPWNGTTGGELIIRSQREAVIDGTILVDSKGYRQEEGPGAGGRGQDGQDIDNQNDRMRGAGGGGAGHVTNGGSGAGWGTSPGSPGVTYSDEQITTPMMGSGGGRGGCYNAADYAPPGTGGDGGGIIQIISPLINVNGLISSNAEDGHNAPAVISGSGGGGSGGSIVLSGEQVSIVGNVTARGGYGGVGGQSGGDGVPGRIRVDYGIKEGEIFTGGESAIYRAGIYWNQLTYIEEGTLTSNAIAVERMDESSANTTAYINANLDIPILSNVKIETRAGSSADTSDDAAWSDWTETTLNQFGYKINSALNDFIQYRIVLSTEENDKSPGIYALNDFAIKLTFTNVAHYAENDIEYAAPDILSPMSLPEVNDNPMDRIENIVTDEGSLPEEVSTLINPSIFYTPDDLSRFTNDIYSNILDDSEPIVTKFAIDESGNMKTEYVQKKDGSIEHYDEDGKVRSVTDGDTGALLVRYYYDVDGNLKDIRLWNERNMLSHEIAAAKSEILKQKIKDLQRLTEEINAAHEDLDRQVSEIQTEFDSIREEIEYVRYITYEVEAESTFGAKTITTTFENPYYSQMIAKLDLAERKFHDNTSIAYFSLENMKNVSRGRIEAASMAALSNLKRQRDVSMVQILRKELTTIIYDCYLKYLGRLPSTQELNDLIEDLVEKSALEQDTYTLDIEGPEGLKAILEAMEERQTRIDQINAIVNDVIDAIENETTGYFSSSDNMEILISALGLAGEEIVELKQEDWNEIKSWLEYNQENTMHFGQSAFLVLKELIDDYYKSHPDELANPDETDLERYVRLAVHAILIDILTGVINPFIEDDLMLSLFALAKAAEVEGLSLDSYKLDWDDLVAQVADYNQLSIPKLIVHMNSNHYVLVTGIDAEDNVTYYEPNMGESGESIAVSKKEFLNVWEGYTLSARAPPEPEKRLTSLEAQRIKGSSVFMVISIVCSIISFGLSFIDNKIAQILSKVFAIVAVVFAGLEILSNLKAIFDGFVQGIKAFKDIFVTAFKKIGDFFAGTLTTFAKESLTLSKALPALGKTIGEAIFHTVISIPTTITMSRGLELIGMDERFARIVSSFISNGMTMGANVASGFNFNIGGAMQGFVVSGIRELGDVFDIEPAITNIVSISAGTLVGAGFDAFENGFKIFDENGDVIQNLVGTDAVLQAIGNTVGTTILPNIAGELAYWGMQELGELLGIDPRISYLAGIGIRSSLQAGLGTFGSGGTPGEVVSNMWKAVQDGLKEGITNVALEWAGQELGLSPLVSSLIFRGIQGAIEGALEYDGNFVQGILDAAKNDFFNILTFGGMGNDPWARAVYISKIQDFARIITSNEDPLQGLIDAVTTYATAVFHSSTIAGILGQGGIVDMVTNRAVVRDNEDGIRVKRIYYFEGDEEQYFDIAADSNLPIEKRYKLDGRDILIKEKYEQDLAGGGVRLIERRIEETIISGVKSVYIFDGQGKQKGFEIYDANGVKKFESDTHENILTFDETTKTIITGNLKDLDKGIVYTFKDGEVVEIKNIYDTLDLDIKGYSMLSPIYLNSNLDSGETVVRLNSLNSLGSEVSNADSYLYDSRFDEMLNIAHQYASSDGNMDLSTFGDYGYWDSFEDLAEQYYGWSYELYDTLGPVSIEESSTYDSILNSIEKRSFIDQLKGNIHEMNTFFDFCGQMALKAKGVITEVAPSMFALVKGLGAWEQEAY